MIIVYEEPSDETRVQTQADTNMPQRTRIMLAKLQNSVVTLDNIINDEGELVHYTFYANTKPMNLTEELKDPIWMNAMI